MAITRVKCRARVEVAGITVETPFVQSFNVRKQRGQVSTFDASLKVRASESSQLTSGDVKIYAGEDSASNLIFTGMCRTAKVSPCFDDPQYVMISIAGADKLSLLQGKKFTRRCRATKAAWASITSVVRRGLKSGKFAYNTEANFEMNEGRQEKENPVSGYRSTTAVDGMGPGNPQTGAPPENVTVNAQVYNEELDETAGGDE